jgi:hypothetical protein
MADHIGASNCPVSCRVERVEYHSSLLNLLIALYAVPTLNPREGRASVNSDKIKNSRCPKGDAHEELIFTDTVIPYHSGDWNIGKLH